MKISELKNGDMVSFETNLNERRQNMTYLGSVSWDIAVTLGVDVQARHRLYSIEMPEGGRPASYKDYSYAIFGSVDGPREIYGHPWIKEDTLELKDTVVYQMIIPTATEDQLNSLRSFATAIGITNFTLNPL